MNWKIFRQVLCVILALMTFGCRSIYEMNLYSKPSGVTVQIGTDIRGRTPCKLEIPKGNKLIRDHYIDITYILDDGREITRTYDIRNYQPSKVNKFDNVLEPIRFTIAGIFYVPAIILFVSDIDMPDGYDGKDSYVYKPLTSDYSRKKEVQKEESNILLLIGAGLIITGNFVYHILGGKSKTDKVAGYDIFETFDGVDSVPIN